jgi:hypothetical protein
MAGLALLDCWPVRIYLKFLVIRLPQAWLRILIKIIQGDVCDEDEIESNPEFTD